MARSFKASQVNKLGEKLRRQAHPTPEDLETLQRIKADYEPAIAKTQALLRERLGLESSSRPKTVNTIIEKLKREKTRLSAMQDIAGVRVVQPVTLAQQDALVARISALFPGAKIVDRRAVPSHGYRAVHVIATVDDFPVEIQVRTRLQDLWAQIFEKLADRVGREIRYGGSPALPKTLLDKLAGVLEGLGGLSVNIATAESMRSLASEESDVALVAKDLAMIEREMALLLESVDRLRE